jgi:hypothetical protein
MAKVIIASKTAIAHLFSSYTLWAKMREHWENLASSTDFRKEENRWALVFALLGLFSGFLSTIWIDYLSAIPSTFSSILVAGLTILFAILSVLFFLGTIGLAIKLVSHVLFVAFEGEGQKLLGRIVRNVRDFKIVLDNLERRILENGVAMEQVREEFEDELPIHLATYYTVVRNRFVVTAIALIIATPLAFAGLYLAVNSVDVLRPEHAHDLINLFHASTPIERLISALASSGTVFITMGFDGFVGCLLPDLVVAVEAFFSAIALLFALGVALTFYMEASRVERETVVLEIRKRLDNLTVVKVLAT